MAKPKLDRTIEDILNIFNDRIRALELAQRTIGDWTLVQDQATGDLIATKYNGQGVPLTVRLVALA